MVIWFYVSVFPACVKTFLSEQVDGVPRPIESKSGGIAD